MYQEFISQELLQQAVIEDKDVTGPMSATANRYPFRFVLFDNFKEAYSFVDFLTNNRHCNFFSVTNWCDSDYPDSMITQSALSSHIIDFIDSEPSTKDYVLSPFSEMARFYEQSYFHSLVTSLKSKEGSTSGQRAKQRVYIPVVGQSSKFARYHNDSQMFVWYCRTGDNDGLCKLILTDGTDFGVAHLDEIGCLVNTVKEWLELWRKQEFHPKVISTSSSLYVNAEYALPDNAFSIVTCNNIFDFLTKGLDLKLTDLSYDKEEDEYWRIFAGKIDVRQFSLDTFFNKYFIIYGLEDYRVFIKEWFLRSSDFDRWLLKKYYIYKFCNKGYICEVLNKMQGLQDRDLVSGLLLEIFNHDNREELLEERTQCLEAVADKKVILPTETERVLKEELEEMAKVIGYQETLQYVSPISDTERKLMISWIHDMHISHVDLKGKFDDLVAYMRKNTGVWDKNLKWILDYISEYKTAKLYDCCPEPIEATLLQYNKNQAEFLSWYEEFPTVPTVLNGRKDIDVYYWIDGLGIDWIPYIQWLISHEGGMYLNEVHIARAKYPTTTDVNKPILEELAGGKENLKKIGSLDEYAHTPVSYPDSIVGELKVVKDALRQIVNEYAGKKIAILSDHGLTSLAQYCDRVKLDGFKPNHQGRVATTTGNITADDNYLTIADTHTICALNHHSLCAKTNLGQSAHGGCTPEEALVPVMIISDEKNSNTYSITQLTRKLQGASSMQFKIIGLDSLDMPCVLYNGQEYAMNHVGNNVFETELLAPVEGNTKVTLKIGDYTKDFNFTFMAGLEEEDMGL